MDKDAAPKHQLPEYTLGEEIANSVTHGIGALLSLIGTAILLYRAVHEYLLGNIKNVSLELLYFTTSKTFIYNCSWIVSLLTFCIRNPRKARKRTA